jgi:succinoglycan biosynthesis protein ExoW
MRRIGVVIPYYQRDAQVLACALRSVAAQDIADAEIKVVVVDDASPTPAEAGLGALAGTRLAGTARVIKRENGGAGAARNTGLVALLGEVDAVALLDSDDVWEPHHLRAAAACLEGGADVFFADFCDFDEAKPYLPSIPELETLLAMAQPDAAAGAPPAYRVEGGAGGAFASLAAATYLAHTSTIVFRADRFREARFMTDRAAGEDHVFFLDLALGARRLAFALAPSMRQGRGVNIYASAREWGSEADILRRSANLAKTKLILRRAAWPEATRAALRAAAWRERRMIAWLLFRQALREKAPPLRALRSALAADAASVLLAPFLAAAFLADRDAERARSEGRPQTECAPRSGAR